MWQPRTTPTLACLVLAALLTAFPASAALQLGAEQIVQAAGADLVVPGYSVPSFVDWNADGLKDLIIGEGGGLAVQGKVRVYLNGGTVAEPSFTGFFYAQSAGLDLWVPATGCLGIFPRVVYWNADARKDLLAGEAGGKVRLFTNIGTDAEPTFGPGVYLQVGLPGQKVDLSVGFRATPIAIDWNSDGRKDLVVGALDGKLRVYLNEGTDGAPDFRAVLYAQDGGVDLSAPTGRTSPCLCDLDGDGGKDLVTGNTEGQLLYYHNAGSDAAPVFAGYAYVEAAETPIDLAGSARSRPFLCDWTNDQEIDLLIGSGDGLVRLYEGEGSAAVDDLSGAQVKPVVRWLDGSPNPVQAGATCRLELARPGHVRVELFDVSGLSVARLLDEQRPAGIHPVRWTAVDEAGRAVPRGVYFLRVECGGARDSRTLVLTR